MDEGRVSHTLEAVVMITDFIFIITIETRKVPFLFYYRSKVKDGP